MTDDQKDERPWGGLHIYEQSSHHMPAHLIGTRDGLQVLRDAIDAVLKGGEWIPYRTFYQCDGEAYEVEVAMVTQAWFNALPTSYSDYRNLEWSEGERAAFSAAIDGRARPDHPHDEGAL